MNNLTKKSINDLVFILNRQNLEISKFVNLLSKKIKSTLDKNKKIVLCGNGGSSADADHFAAEFNVKYVKKRKPLNAVSLSNSSVITAIGNDFSFKMIFSRQIQALGQKNDLLIVFSTSGKSLNILEAINTAKKNKIRVIGLFGMHKTILTKKCDFQFHVQSRVTARIQEVHKLILHSVFEILDNHY